MALGSIVINLLLKTGAFNNDAKLAERRLQELGKQAKIAGAAIGGALVTGVGVFIRNTVEAEQNLAQLEAILKSTGNAAGYSRDQLVGMAQDLQKVSTFSSDDIVVAQTRLLSYSGIVGENVPRAMQAVIDQSARLGMSLAQSSETIGRALESPAKAAAALAQQGFGAAFTKEVRGTIDALVAAGKEADAQILILEILEESYGGAAEAARGTFGGSLEALKHTVNDIMTGQGGSLDGLTQSVNDLIDTLNDPEFRRGTEYIAQSFVDFTNDAANAIAPLMREIRGLGTLLEGMGMQADAVGIRLKALFTLDRTEFERSIALMERGASLMDDGIRGALGGHTPNPFQNVRSSVSSTYDNPQGADAAAVAAAKAAAAAAAAKAAAAKADAEARRAQAAAERDAAKALRELMQAEKEAADWARAFTAAQEDAVSMLEDMRAEAEGPAAVALLKYARLEQELGLMMAENVLTFTQYAEAMQLVHDAREKEIAGMKEQAVAAKDEMTVFAEQAQRNMQSWLGDSLYNGLSGKFDGIADAFSDMLRRMVAEMMASQILQFFMGNSTTGQAGLFDLFRTDGEWATGGYTGPGGRNQPAGVVHKGEVVWSQHDIARAGGVGVVESMRRGLRGYASGGVVGGGRAVAAPSANVKVEVINNSGAEVSRESGRTPDGQVLERIIIGTVQKGFGGGDFDGAMQMFGSRRQGAR